MGHDWSLLILMYVCVGRPEILSVTAAQFRHDSAERCKPGFIEVAAETKVHTEKAILERILKEAGTPFAV
jgi:hypothetical protein